MRDVTKPFYRIFYDDGSTYDGAVEEAPCEGVIIVVQDDSDVGREVLHMKDYYYWEHMRWWGADRWGMEDYLRRPGWKKVCAGRNTLPANYSALYDRANQDPDFATKSAFNLTEGRKR
jgi:hypothetical protein